MSENLENFLFSGGVASRRGVKFGRADVGQMGAREILDGFFSSWAAARRIAQISRLAKKSLITSARFVSLAAPKQK